jgi:uracil-DNA glycosylase
MLAPEEVRHMLSDGTDAVRIQVEAAFKCKRSPANRRYNLVLAMTASPKSLAALNAQIVACELCPRLRGHCIEIARVRRRAYVDCEYWGRPVPSFGDPEARVLALGLAPGAHGSNRTGRPFTGDGSGDFLFPVLHEAGFASHPQASSRDDGMKLKGLWITSVVRCAPPGNKPSPEEQRNCAPWVDKEIALLKNLRVVVCLGRIAFDGLLAHEMRHGATIIRSSYAFGHGAEYTLPGGLKVIASYHPSLQNTNTGKLTRPMFLQVFKRARLLAGLS